MTSKILNGILYVFFPHSRMAKGMKRLSLKRRALYYIIIAVGLLLIPRWIPNSYAWTILKSKTVDYTGHIDIQPGDLIFQHLPGPLGKMVADVTHSPFSHCGIIVREGQDFFVLEAIGPVKLTPLQQWISYGVKDRFAVLRLKPRYQSDIPNIIRAALRYAGRPYDIRFEWDDRKIYCSELIYKAVAQGAGLKLAEFAALGDMDWQPYEKTIRAIAGGSLPLERKMITPQALLESDKLHTIYSNFPPEHLPGASSDIAALEGHWSGTYMLAETPLKANIMVSGPGWIRAGVLQSGLDLSPVAPLAYDPHISAFKYALLSQNGVRILVSGRLDQSQDYIFGEWKDQLGFEGTFWLARQDRGKGEITRDVD